MQQKVSAVLATSVVVLLGGFLGLSIWMFEKYVHQPVPGTPTLTQPVKRPIQKQPPQEQQAGDADASQDGVACSMEAKLCPDGVTYVGRTGPRCEFAACPNE